MKIPKEYNILLDYPEFNIDTIRNKYKQWIEDDQQSGEGHFDYPNWIFDIQPAFEYVVIVYAPDSELSSIKSLRERKEIALKKADIPKDQWSYIIKNENFMIGDMATRLFRELMDFDYEILISAKEAVETLLEVVRKPISTI